MLSFMNVLLLDMVELNNILDEVLNLIMFFVKILLEHFNAAVSLVNVRIQTIVMILELF